MMSAGPVLLDLVEGLTSNTGNFKKTHNIYIVTFKTDIITDILLYGEYFNVFSHYNFDVLFSVWQFDSLSSKMKNVYI